VVRVLGYRSGGPGSIPGVVEVRKSDHKTIDGVIFQKKKTKELFIITAVRTCDDHPRKAPFPC
jgi:hypothetical protein